MRNKKFSITTPLLAAITVLIVIANIILGLILTAQSRSSMRSFQDNPDLEYFYGIHNDGNDRFSFTIDPAPTTPESSASRWSQLRR